MRVVDQVGSASDASTLRLHVWRYIHPIERCARRRDHKPGKYSSQSARHDPAEELLDSQINLVSIIDPLPFSMPEFPTE